MKIYSASVLVINNDASVDHYPLITGIEKYSSCQDYLSRGIIPYIEKSPTVTRQTQEVSINIVQGEISADGSIVKTGGLDKTLYFKKP